MKYIVYTSLEWDCEEEFIIEKEQVSLFPKKLFCDDCLFPHEFVPQVWFDSFEKLSEFLANEEFFD